MLNLLLLALVCTQDVSHANEKSKTNSDEQVTILNQDGIVDDSDDPGFLQNFFSEIEDQRGYFSDQLMEKSNQLDIFFSNNQYLKTRNTTHLLISNEISVLEEEGFQNNFDLSLKLKLPRSQNKLQFQFDQQVDDLRSGGNNFENYSTIERKRSENGRSKAGLNFYQNFFKTDVRLTAGADINKKLIPWTNLKLKNDLFFSKSKEHYVQIINDFYGQTTTGTEHHININYNYPIQKNLIFRQSNQSRYQKQNNTFEVSNGFSIFHLMNTKNSIAYNYFVVSVNPPSRDIYIIDRHLMNIGFRHRLYKKHYYISLVPGLISTREKNWEVLSSFQLKIDVYIGNP